MFQVFFLQISLQSRESMTNEQDYKMWVWQGPELALKRICLGILFQKKTKNILNTEKDRF